jgi:hypothetical protein
MKMRSRPSASPWRLTMTPIQRREGQAGVYTPEEVAGIEQSYVDRTISSAQASDPDRPPPPPTNTISAVDSYNDVFFERGSQVAVSMENPGPRSSRFHPTAGSACFRQRARGGARSRETAETTSANTTIRN